MKELIVSKTFSRRQVRGTEPTKALFDVQNGDFLEEDEIYQGWQQKW
jgi:hypothetical protein